MPFPSGERGVSLVELIVAMAIISIGCLGVIRAFAFITKGVVSTRNKSLGSNLSQEKVEELKNKGYFNVLPTSTPTYNSDFSPAYPYDTMYHPEEKIAIGGKIFIRHVYVERVEDSGSGNFIPVPYNGLDTSVKRITVHSIWKDGNTWKKQTLSNIVSDPQLAQNATFNGTVTDSGGGTIQNAYVFVTNNPFFYGYTDADGKYAFAVSPGSYSLRATAPGYDPSAMVSLAPNSGDTLTQNFTLTAIASGSVSGSAWINDHLLISQVVAASNTVVGDLSSQNVEYVELFNPTTSPINIGSASGEDIVVGYMHHDNDSLHNFCGTSEESITYVSTYVPAGRYFLIANATAFYILGSQVLADAYWDNTLYEDRIKDADRGCIYIATGCGADDNTIDTSKLVDSVAWNKNSGTTFDEVNCIEGNQIPFGPAGNGLEVGHQIVRLSSISAVSDTYGRAYDSGDNLIDFASKLKLLASGAIEYRPRTTSDAAQTNISGTPAVGAVVTADDGLSTSTQAWRDTYSGYPYATFTLVGIATGTVTVSISSKSAFLEISSISVPSSGSDTAIPNATTVSPWLLAGLYNVLLTSSTTDGTVTGLVRDPNLNPLDNILVDVHPGGEGRTNAQGVYSIRVPADTYPVTANPNSDNRAYTTATNPSVTVTAGQISSGIDFILSGAGDVSGYVCLENDTNPYPGITVAAYDSSNNLVQQVVSGSDGKFLFNTLSSGTYTFKPILDEGQTTTPISDSQTVASGSEVVVDTFTISGGYGTITGSVTLNGSLITTGVLVVATTGTITGSMPPDIVNPTILSQTPYYMTSSLADGTYSMKVRTGTSSETFNVYAWHTTYNGDTASPSKKSASVTVPGNGSATQGFAWP